MPTIRVATPADANDLAMLAERTFRDTFAAANSAEDLALHVQHSYATSIQAREIGDPTMLTLVCETEGALIAFAQLRWHAAPVAVRGAAPGEIQRLYVDHAWHGKGIAPQLMEACLDALRGRGSDVVWLGVWEHNPRAIAFYQKFGFVEVGAHVFALGRDRQRDLIMIRPVQPITPDA